MLALTLTIAIVLVATTLLFRQHVMMRDIRRAGMSERLTYSHEGRKFSMNLAELHREVKPRSRFRDTLRIVLWVECTLLVLLLAAKLLSNVSPSDNHVPPPIKSSSSTAK